MSETPYLNFDLDQQLKQIETFTERQQLEVSQLLNDSHKFFSTDIQESTGEVQHQVSDMISGIESQLEQEIDKINQQLQQLLPNQSQ